MLERIVEIFTPPQPTQENAEDEADLDAEIAELEAQNAAMEAKLQLHKRKSFQAAKARRGS